MTLLKPGDEAPDFETTDQDGQPLSLADTERKIVKAYGAWGEKSLYGRLFKGIHRITYLIDETGRVAAVWPKVKPGEHARQILEFVDRAAPAKG